MALIALMFTKSNVMAQSLTLIEEKKEGQYKYKNIDAQKGNLAISQLKSISDFNVSIKQPYSKFDDLYDHSIYAQIELEGLLHKVAKETGSGVILSGVKNKDRAHEKILAEFNGDVTKITDIARGTLVADSVEEILGGFNRISEDANIVAVKNRFKEPQPSGYRDLKILIELPESKIIAEVQIHLRAIANVKSGPEHDLYEIVQRIERNAKYENRPLTELESVQINYARKESQELYRNAWELYKPSQIHSAA